MKKVVKNRQVKKILVRLLVIIGIWLFFAAIFPTLFIPNMLLIKTEIQKTEKIQGLSNSLKAEDPEQTIRNIFDYVTTNYVGVEEVWKIANYPKLFRYDVEKLLESPQFLACHLQNLVFITLAVNTGQFNETDFYRQQTFSWFLTTHQYMKLEIKNQSYRIDPFRNVFEQYG
jgi:hypothetical protein